MTGFKPNARLILELGDQLIRSENIAVLELVKNSYDACATLVTISLRNIEDPNAGEIIIEDNGYGMTRQIIEDVWLQPGTTFKAKKLSDSSSRIQCGRTPLGEKGIGRFGVHKLGDEIEMVSKKVGEKEALLKIDWKMFQSDQLLESIPIKVEDRLPEVFTGSRSGTRIVIRKLRQPWTRLKVRDLQRSITSMSSPFQGLESFKVLLKVDKPDWLSGLMKFDEIYKHALFEAEARILGNRIVELNYQFRPWATMNQLKPREFRSENILMMMKLPDESGKRKVLTEIDLSRHDIGEVRLNAALFDFDSNILSLGVQDKRGLKDYLRSNGGFRVYRDGVRVYDYGEPGNDWLSLDIDRVNSTVSKISNNLVIGAIYLNKEGSSRLVEKTNREGFIEDEAYWDFQKAVKFTVSQIVAQRNIDKDRLRNHYGSTGKKVLVEDNLEILKTTIAENLPENQLKKDVLKLISEIKSDYKMIQDIYVRSASAGISFGIVIHEIEKIIQELLYVVESKNPSVDFQNKVKQLTWHLGKLIDGYGSMIKAKPKQLLPLQTVLNSALFNVSYRLQAHQVQMIREFDLQKPFSTKVNYSPSLITGVLVNIIDNSLYWMHYGKTQTKKIFIDISDKLPGYICVLIADNGPGFTLPTEEIVKPFISNKPDGMGIGLHLAHEIMNSHGGELLFPAETAFSVPAEFAAGAIICLAFRINKYDK